MFSSKDHSRQLFESLNLDLYSFQNPRRGKGVGVGHIWSRNKRPDIITHCDREGKSHTLQRKGLCGHEVWPPWSWWPKLANSVNYPSWLQLEATRSRCASIMIFFDHIISYITIMVKKWACTRYFWPSSKISDGVLGIHLESRLLKQTMLSHWIQHSRLNALVKISS